MSKILIFMAGIAAGYALHNHREQSIEKIASTVAEKSRNAWASAADHVRTTDSPN